MPIAKKRLHIGKSYRIDVSSDGNTPDISFVQRGWMPKSGAPTPPEVLTLVAPPGGGDHDQGTVPDCHALELQWDVPDEAGTKVRIVVTEGGQAVEDRTVTTDKWLTFVVIP
jgi:hypothetical protein